MDADAIMDVGYMNAYGLENLGRLVLSLPLLHCNEDANEQPYEDLTRTKQDRVLSAMLLFTFLSTLILLYIYPVSG